MADLDLEKGDCTSLDEQKANISCILDRVTDLEDQLYGVTRGDGTLITSRPPPAIGNPSPLGLLGFAIVSWLSGIMKIASDETARHDGLFAATAFFIGGVAQVIAGIIQFAKNETHSATAFSFYGLHWVTQGVLLGIHSIEEVTLPSHSPTSVATYFSLLAFTTFLLWLPTFRMNKVLTTTLTVIFVVFILDAIGAGGSRAIEVAAGYASCTAAALGFYLAMLDLVNETWNRPIFPLFPHRDHKADYDNSKGKPYIPRTRFHKAATSSAHL